MNIKIFFFFFKICNYYYSKDKVINFTMKIIVCTVGQNQNAVEINCIIG